jgi:hypothetical protein
MGGLIPYTERNSPLDRVCVCVCVCVLHSVEGEMLCCGLALHRNYDNFILISIAVCRESYMRNVDVARVSLPMSSHRKSC